jgi:hemolysin D
LRQRRHGAVRRWLGATYADRDREFLPAALEILETPPSPIRIWLLQAICALVAISIGWMFIGRIDVIAIAQGKVQPAGRVKLVQLWSVRLTACRPKRGWPRAAKTSLHW